MQNTEVNLTVKSSLLIEFFLDENDSSIRNQNYMDYYMAEDEDSSVSHSPNNEQDIKPFNQDKSLLVLTLDSMTNVTQVMYILLSSWLIKK